MSFTKNIRNNSANKLENYNDKIFKLTRLTFVLRYTFGIRPWALHCTGIEYIIVRLYHLTDSNNLEITKPRPERLCTPICHRFDQSP